MVDLQDLTRWMKKGAYITFNKIVGDAVSDQDILSLHEQPFFYFLENASAICNLCYTDWVFLVTNQVLDLLEDACEGLLESILTTRTQVMEPAQSVLPDA